MSRRKWPTCPPMTADAPTQPERRRPPRPGGRGTGRGAPRSRAADRSARQRSRTTSPMPARTTPSRKPWPAARRSRPRRWWDRPRGPPGRSAAAACRWTAPGRPARRRRAPRTGRPVRSRSRSPGLAGERGRCQASRPPDATPALRWQLLGREARGARPRVWRWPCGRRSTARAPHRRPSRPTRLRRCCRGRRPSGAARRVVRGGRPATRLRPRAPRPPAPPASSDPGDPVARAVGSSRPGRPPDRP